MEKVSACWSQIHVWIKLVNKSLSHVWIKLVNKSVSRAAQSIDKFDIENENLHDLSVYS